MEKVLQTILEEVKGVKKEVQETKIELRGEIQDTEKRLRTELQSELQKTEKGLHGEMQGMKQELHREMQGMKQELIEVMDQKLEETKTELRNDMDERFSKQSKEIAEKLNQIIIMQERRDNKFWEEMRRQRELQQEMLKDIRKIKIEHKEHEYKIAKLEYKQGEIEERLERIG